MKICVCGWYFEKYDIFYKILWKLHHLEKHSVHIVANRYSPFLNICDLPYNIRANFGLEFGAYDYFLKNIWDRKSSMLFMHDDIVINPFMREYEILPPERIFDHFTNLDIDHCYVFSSREDDVLNWGKHGRMFYCSSKLLEWITINGGFWYDENNYGYTMGIKPGGIKSYNSAINKFDDMLDRTEMAVKHKIYIPAMKFLYRGGAVTTIQNYNGGNCNGNDFKENNLYRGG